MISTSRRAESVRDMHDETTRSPRPWPASGRQMPIGCDAMALHICWLGHERLRVEIERFEQVLDEITEDDEE